MTLAFERYETQAVDIDTYISSMKSRRDQFLENIESAEIDGADREIFSQARYRFLVITEDWCIDSAQFVPVLVKLAREVPGLEIRVLLREEHRDLADNYRNKMGHQPIPVVIVFDEHGNELGHMLERPDKVSEEMAAETRCFQEQNPHLEGIKRNIDRMPEETKALVKAHSREWRVTQQDRFGRHFLDELRDIVETASDARAA